jgi:hypothetical protein
MGRCAIVASVCLLAHWLLFEELLWTAGSPEANSQSLPARVTFNGDAEEALQWIALDPQAFAAPSQPKPRLPTVHLQRIDVPKALSNVAVLVQDLELPPTPEATAADAGRLSKMYGRYVGQITSRVERAWRRPRTAIGDSSFSCQVRILQDANGNVNEVMLAKCNGDVRWQLSLVQAIQSASPLPAPPDPDVFSRTLRLEFKAEAYSAQSPADDYESLPSARMAQGVQDAQRAEKVFSHLDDSHGSVIVRLNISGHDAAMQILDAAAVEPK